MHLRFLGTGAADWQQPEPSGEFRRNASMLVDGALLIDGNATILDMLLQLRDETGMTVIFITHDIGLAYYISDTVYIMEHGKFVESGKADDVILNPTAAYTKRLISDVPKIHEEWDLSTVDLQAQV